jgi:hypothetical protein
MARIPCAGRPHSGEFRAKAAIAGPVLPLIASPRERRHPALQRWAPMTKSTGGQSGPPAFLTLDDRIPVGVRELLLEADGCVANGYLTGGTVCAQRAVDALLKFEKADGPTFDSRVHSLGEKHPAVAQLLLTVLVQLGDHASRDTPRLTANTLQLLVVALKAVAYEIYVVGPDRTDRLQYVRRVLETTERRPSAPSGARPAA